MAREHMSLAETSEISVRCHARRAAELFGFAVVSGPRFLFAVVRDAQQN